MANELLELSDVKVASGALAVTPGASALSRPGFAIVVGGAGTVTVTTHQGQSVAIPCAVGVPVYIRHTHITAAVATGVVSLH
jgi:hypothetical protein